MADEDQTLKQYPLDYKTGIVTYKGQELTYQELQWEFDQEEADLSDEWAARRNYSSDIQNLWGSKSNRFKDDWFYMKKPVKKLKGYPRDVKNYYESAPVQDWGGDPQ